MRGKPKPNVRLATLVILGAIAAGALAVVALHYIRKPLSVKGAVIKEDADTRKQSPITDVVISVADNLALADAKSDFLGYFKLTLRPGVKRGQSITLRLRHPDYQPIDLKAIVSDELQIVSMASVPQDASSRSNPPEIPVANVFVRYSIESTTSVNIGTGVKTFQVENKGNVRCDGHLPCSPDGNWKAATARASLDAGEGDVYDNARLSCIAGPCPFTKIETDQFSEGGRIIGVTVLNWSDTTTFLLQAEVSRTEVNDIARESYPVIFGDSMNFTLPAAAEGPSLEAELSGENIVFPLGPAPVLSWAVCNVRVDKDQSKMYRCELKPGYQFR
jgi:hypothetical protein